MAGEIMMGQTEGFTYLAYAGTISVEATEGLPKPAGYLKTDGPWPDAHLVRHTDKQLILGFDQALLPPEQLPQYAKELSCHLGGTAINDQIIPLTDEASFGIETVRWSPSMDPDIMPVRHSTGRKIKINPKLEFKTEKK